MKLAKYCVCIALFIVSNVILSAQQDKNCPMNTNSGSFGWQKCKHCTLQPLTTNKSRNLIPGPTKVCVISSHQRLSSLFSTNLIAMLGNGHFTYDVMEPKRCFHSGNCRNIQDVLPDGCRHDDPVILLYVAAGSHKMTLDLHVARMVQNGFFDLAILGGDEKCKYRNSSEFFDFRYYHSTIIMHDTGIGYIPLGPRFEFERVFIEQMKRAHDRRYIYNFMGALSTSPDRGRMVEAIEPDILSKWNITNSTDGFMHIIDKWKGEATSVNGYLTPDKYRDVLLESVFTLCPSGNNVESYRLFEALEAGSIPVIAKSHSYKDSECVDPLEPLIASGAPFPVLDRWQDLPALFHLAKTDKEWVQDLQCKATAWYRRYLSTKLSNVEDVLMRHWKKRLRKSYRDFSK